jgi:alkyl hydroperoxide reductase subunit AhpC
VVVFYPADWTFVCPTELVGYSDAAAKFAELKANVIAVSTDSVHSHIAWINTPKSKGGLGPMNIPVVEDPSHAISKHFQVLVEDPADGMVGKAVRGTFIIDPKGIIRSATINDDQIGRSVDETLRLLEACVYADEHGGEVCPMGWKKGGKTIVADPIKSKEYFAAVNA